MYFCRVTGGLRRGVPVPGYAAKPQQLGRRCRYPAPQPQPQRLRRRSLLRYAVKPQPQRVRRRVLYALLRVLYLSLRGSLHHCPTWGL